MELVAREEAVLWTWMLAVATIWGNYTGVSWWCGWDRGGLVSSCSGLCRTPWPQIGWSALRKWGKPRSGSPSAAGMHHWGHILWPYFTDDWSRELSPCWDHSGTLWMLSPGSQPWLSRNGGRGASLQGRWGLNEGGRVKRGASTPSGMLGVTGSRNGQSPSRGLRRRRGPLPSQRRYLFIIE